MTCGKCRKTACECDNQMPTQTIIVEEKMRKLGANEILLGCGTEKQTRYGHICDIEALNAKHIVCCDEDGKATGKTMQDVCDAMPMINPYSDCDIGARNKLAFSNWAEAKIDLSPMNGLCNTGLPDSMAQHIAFQNQDGTCYKGESWISTMCGDNYNEPNQMAVEKRQWFRWSDIFKMLECVMPMKKTCDMDSDNCAIYTPLPTICERVTDLENMTSCDKVVTDMTVTDEGKVTNGHKFKIKLDRSCDLPPLMDTFIVPDPEIDVGAPFGGNKTLELNHMGANGERTTNLGTVFEAPSDGMYHVTGNIAVKLNCPSGSANGFYSWGSRVMVDGVIAINHKYQGFAGNYKGMAPSDEYLESSFVGGVLTLTKGQRVTISVFEYTPDGFKAPDRTDFNAEMSYHRL